MVFDIPLFPFFSETHAWLLGGRRLLSPENEKLGGILFEGFETVFRVFFHFGSSPTREYHETILLSRTKIHKYIYSQGICLIFRQPLSGRRLQPTMIYFGLTGS
jgi:hypothetical protein